LNVAFDDPANAKVLAFLAAQGDVRPENRSAPPSVYDLHRNSLGTHPDLAARLWDEITVKLPERCAWVVHGRPVLVNPTSGILFGYARGTHEYALRLPDAERIPGLRSGEPGEEWVLGDWHKAEPDWCLAAYRAVG
jgi:hypothetical protein